MRLLIVAAFATLALLFPTPALAHASLTHCSITNNQVFRLAHAPSTVTATFAEDLVPNKSWIAVFERQAYQGLVTELQHSIVNFHHPNQMTLRLPRLGRRKHYLIRSF